MHGLLAAAWLLAAPPVAGARPESAACRFEPVRLPTGAPPSALCAAWAAKTRFTPGIELSATDCTLAGAIPGLVARIGAAELVVFQAEMQTAGQPRFVVLVLAVRPGPRSSRWATSVLAHVYDSGQPYSGAHVALGPVDTAAAPLLALDVEAATARADGLAGRLETAEGLARGYLALGAQGPRWLGAAPLRLTESEGPLPAEPPVDAPTANPTVTTREMSLTPVPGAPGVLEIRGVQGAPLLPPGRVPLASLPHGCPLEVPLPGRL